MRCTNGSNMDLSKIPPAKVTRINSHSFCYGDKCYETQQYEKYPEAKDWRDNVNWNMENNFLDAAARLQKKDPKVLYDMLDKFDALNRDGEIDPEQLDDKQRGLYQFYLGMSKALGRKVPEPE